MTELIKIERNTNGEQLVSGRELHINLQSAERFSKWFSRMLDYGFEEGVDYTPYQKVHPQNNQEITDYVIKLDMAKEICMLQKSEQGKRMRRYFIECERKLRELNTPKTQSEVILLLAQQNVEIEKKQIEQQKQLNAIENKLKIVEAKQVNSPQDFYSVVAWCNLINKKVELSEAKALGKKCTGLSKELECQTGETPDPRFGKVKTYHVDVLKEVMGGQ